MEEELPVKYQWLEDLGKAGSPQQIRSKKLDNLLGFNGPTFFMQKSLACVSTVNNGQMSLIISHAINYSSKSLRYTLP